MFGDNVPEERRIVNGAYMLSDTDKPCEFIGKCIGGNENCSYEGRDLPDGCTLYNDCKKNE